MKLISDKKVYPSQKNVEKPEVSKISNISNVMTNNESNVKRDMMDIMKTSDNFFMTSSN